MKHLFDVSGNVTVRAARALLGPQIASQSGNQVAAPGDIVTFSVVVVDADTAAFQWEFNGADISGATGDCLLLTNVSVANEGQYSVVVTNSAGTVVSVPAVLTLRRNPAVKSSSPPLLNVYSDADGFVTVAPLKPNYNLGETVTLTATPFTDSVFAGWIGDLNTIDNPTALQLDGNKTVRAKFVSTRTRLIALSGAGGSVTAAPMKLSYDSAETVMLTATPFSSSVFLSWTGDLSSSDNPVTLTMNGNKKVRARFASAASVPSGLIALWRGETDPSDLVGAHHGTFFAGALEVAPSVTASGKVGGALNFDGTVHVLVPDTPELRPAQFTAEAWVFPTAPNIDPQTIIARGFPGNTWDLRLVNRIPQFWSHGGQGLAAPAVIPLNEWTHLAITFDGLIKRLYVDGAQVASHEEAGALSYGAAVPITIGSDFQSNRSGNHFNGRIDEVALYSRALMAEEVLGIFNADFLGKNFAQPYFVSSSRLPDGVRGADYAQQLTTILGTPPVSFALPEELLAPTGISLSPAGLLSGVPNAAGTFEFPVRATDAAGTSTEQERVLRVV